MRPHSIPDHVSHYELEHAPDTVRISSANQVDVDMLHGLSLVICLTLLPEFLTDISCGLLKSVFT